MIKVGHRKNTRYWGMRTVTKMARLKKPVECYSRIKGKVLFDPIIAQIEWDNPPSGDKNEFWFPYWITIDGEEKYGQFAPMIGEKALLELLQDAIRQGFFSISFLENLDKAITNKLDR